jgi:hypothetical protein
MKNKLVLAIVTLLGFASGIMVARPAPIFAQDVQKLTVSESLHTVTNHSRGRPTFGSHDLGRDRARPGRLSDH